MWNKILIGALVLFLFAAYLFYNAFQTMVGNGGEVENIQNQTQLVINEATLIAVDERNKIYAEMRSEFFKAEETRYIDEKAALDEEAANVSQEIATTNAQFDELRAQYERLQEEIANMMKDVSQAAGLETQAADVSVIVEEVVRLATRSSELKGSLAAEKAKLAALEAEEARLNGLIAVGRKLNSDRQARLSPADLSCHVLICDPNWDYIILDAGLNKGMVIGSRLAVMRDGVKICELAVTMVEGNRASADIVYDTLLPGETIRRGDHVKSVRYN